MTKDVSATWVIVHFDSQLVAWPANDSYKIENYKLNKFIEAYEKAKKNFTDFIEIILK